MKVFRIAIMVAGLSAGNALAGDFSFTGNFKNDNDVQPILFTVTEPNAAVTLQTWSFVGGTNAAGAAISGGGFDPIVTVFDAVSGNKLGFNDDGDHPFDSTLMIDLSAGNYIATITQYSSFSGGSTLSQGFGGSNTFNFGSHDSHWALDILNASSASVGVSYISPVPEPETYAMLLAGLGLMGFIARRRKQIS